MVRNERHLRRTPACSLTGRKCNVIANVQSSKRVLCVELSYIPPNSDHVNIVERHATLSETVRNRRVRRPVNAMLHPRQPFFLAERNDAPVDDEAGGGVVPTARRGVDPDDDHSSSPGFVVAPPAARRCRTTSSSS